MVGIPLMTLGGGYTSHDPEVGIPLMTLRWVYTSHDPEVGIYLSGPWVGVPLFPQDRG